MQHKNKLRCDALTSKYLQPISVEHDIVRALIDVYSLLNGVALLTANLDLMEPISEEVRR
jgi:hypothetical protein